MAQLDSIVHSKLSENVLKQLRARQILTVIDFLFEDPLNLRKITELSFKDVLDIKTRIKERYGGVVKNPSTLLQLEQKNIACTHIKSLDDILQGGLHPGHIYEICGASSSGKTQLCLSIASNVALRSKALVRYIDTKKDFSTSRVETILDAKRCTKEDIDNTLERIRISFVQSSHRLLRVLEYLAYLLKTKKNEVRTRVIIIDSLPGIIFKYSMDPEINFILNRLSNICRFLANEFYLSIIAVNLVTQWHTSDNKNTQSEEFDMLKPTLGKYWSSVPNTRIFLEKITERDRKVTVWKSFQIKTGTTCNLQLNANGMT